MNAQSLKWRMAAVYGALFLGIGVALPYLPVWLKAKGLSAQDIGLALALQSVMRVLVAPAVSHLADRLGRLRPVMAASSLGVLAGLLYLATVAEGRGAILLGVALAFGALAPLMPLSDAYAITMVRRHGLDYGRMRLWGSLSFIFAAVGAGALQDVLPARLLIWLIVLAQVLLFAAIAALPPRERDAGTEQARDTAGEKKGEGIIAILSVPFIVFVIMAGLVQSSHAFVYGFSAIHWKSLGHSGTVVGLLWMTGVIAEIVLFWFSEKVMAHLGAVRLMLLGAAAGLLRWLGLSLNPPLVLLFLLQALHGLSFGATHLGAIEFVRTRLPAARTATAQAAYGAVSHGVFMTAAMWLSGRLYADYGAKGWWAMAVMCLMALLLGLWLRRLARLPCPTTPRRAAR
ncbi:MFS transporter [Thermopetrobacter sp. TC1]|uniref:MFS transporter n=1 Tax=Thermopetrobacter sp. TC1 TaxID=1495045 RepID=UPI00068EDC92|nr:MFS transporter [Thermopetrobacter sp. TC1]